MTRLISALLMTLIVNQSVPEIHHITQEDVPVPADRLYYMPGEHETERYYDDLEELAICVEAEAGNQSLLGRRMVVDVILNRVDSPQFPDTIHEVIEQPVQFSTYWDGAMDRVIEPSELTIKAVQMELEHRTHADVLFFTAGYYNPYCKPWGVVGDHYFGT